MKLVIFWLGRWVPAVILIGIGTWTVVVDRNPNPLSIGAILLGCLSVALSFWIAGVFRRYRQFVASRQANAQGS